MKNRQSDLNPILFDPSGERDRKFEEQGITMLIDTGNGLALFDDLLQLAGEYVDFIKLGFGTTVLYSKELLEKKLQLAKKANVKLYPGGTLFEIALHKGVVNEYFDFLQNVGFDYIEISEGTIDLPFRKRQMMIKEAVANGFTVISECGKKEEGSSCEVKDLERMLYSDLECGASYVIVEGRESGENVGIYNNNGKIDHGFLEDIKETIPDDIRKFLIWEAPQKKQQIELIHFWGRNVNLGNIQCKDAFSLECLRRGLRFDTFSK
ncbi:phosphosulfolactate synthase [Terrilactibacillus tamarindi]|uniref:phosphosulfolactate synthase n=1 Tax=Terrilactibacillus tamarindi TaxID=2599694 RepID=UPI0018AD1037|nr:phosphosulfolactate synthase [Terrilactibacillus tamarindi]